MDIYFQGTEVLAGSQGWFLGGCVRLGKFPCQGRKVGSRGFWIPTPPFPSPIPSDRIRPLAKKNSPYNQNQIFIFQKKEKKRKRNTMNSASQRDFFSVSSFDFFGKRAFSYLILSASHLPPLLPPKSKKKQQQQRQRAGYYLASW